MYKNFVNLRFLFSKVGATFKIPERPVGESSNNNNNINNNNNNNNNDNNFQRPQNSFNPPPPQPVGHPFPVRRPPQQPVRRQPVYRNIRLPNGDVIVIVDTSHQVYNQGFRPPPNQ